MMCFQISIDVEQFAFKLETVVEIGTEWNDQTLVGDTLQLPGLLPTQRSLSAVSIASFHSTAGIAEDQKTPCQLNTHTKPYTGFLIMGFVVCFICPPLGIAAVILAGKLYRIELFP